MRRLCVLLAAYAALLGANTVFAAGKDDEYVLCLTSTYTNANDYEYTYIYFMKCEGKGFEIPANSFLEYDMFISEESAGFSGGVDLVGGSLKSLRDNGSKAGCKDQDGSSPHPSHAHKKAKGRWWHRKIALAPIAGKSFVYGVIAVDGRTHAAGAYKAYYRNIRITDGKGKVFLDLYGGGRELRKISKRMVKGMTGYSISVVPMNEVKVH